MRESSVESQYFDFDMGYLVKSPCKGCDSQKRFPDCMEKCEILDHVQSVLSDSISSSHNFSAVETFDVPMEVLEQV